MKCICGCGAEVESKWRKALFASHHTRSERVKFRYNVYKEEACAGLLAPSDWGTCRVCSRQFPVFKEIHGISYTIRTCPSFINESCGPSYRAVGKTGSYAYGIRELDKEFRTSICKRRGILCQNYSKCSDREFNSDLEARKWDYELHGKDCYK